MADTVLWINDVAMPTPSKLTIMKEAIWSKNTGRTDSGKMVGDIVAHKYTLQIEWATMNQNDSAKLDAAISNAFFSIKFIDPASSNGSFKTITGYAGAPTYPVYSYANGLPRLTGTGVKLIEQ